MTIKQLIREVERVTERLTIKAPSGLIHLKNESENGMNHAIRKLSEYETAEEEGKLVVLPCKSGQDLFGIYNGAIVDGYADGYLMEKTSVHSDYEHWIWFQDKYSKDFWKVSVDDFGKTVFFSHEEAEKALEEMKKQE